MKVSRYLDKLIFRYKSLYIYQDYSLHVLLRKTLSHHLNSDEMFIYFDHLRQISSTDLELEMENARSNEMVSLSNI